MKEGLILGGLATSALLAAEIPGDIGGIAGELGRLGFPGIVVAMMAYYIWYLTKAREDAVRRHEELMVKIAEDSHQAVGQVGNGLEKMASAIDRLIDLKRGA